MSNATPCNPCPLFFRQRRPKTVQARLLAVLGHIQHAAPRQIVDHGKILVPLAEGLLVHPKVADHLRLAPLQPPPDRTLHDRMHLVPRQPQPLRHRLLTGRQQPVDRQPLEQRREAAVRLGPRNRRHPNSVLGTIGPRHLGVQDRAILTGIQVSPTPLRLVVVQRAGAAALGAWPRRRCRCVPSTHAPRLPPNSTPRDPRSTAIQSPKSARTIDGLA